MIRCVVEVKVKALPLNWKPSMRSREETISGRLLSVTPSSLMILVIFSVTFLILQDNVGAIAWLRDDEKHYLNPHSSKLDSMGPSRCQKPRRLTRRMASVAPRTPRRLNRLSSINQHMIDTRPEDIKSDTLNLKKEEELDDKSELKDLLKVELLADDDPNLAKSPSSVQANVPFRTFKVVQPEDASPKRRAKPKIGLVPKLLEALENAAMKFMKLTISFLEWLSKYFGRREAVKSTESTKLARQAGKVIPSEVNTGEALSTLPSISFEEATKRLIWELMIDPQKQNVVIGDICGSGVMTPVYTRAMNNKMGKTMSALGIQDIDRPQLAEKYQGIDEFAASFNLQEQQDALKSLDEHLKRASGMFGKYHGKIAKVAEQYKNERLGIPPQGREKN